MIDDVDFLKENSEKDSVVIFIDSQKRDYSRYPTPSEYTIVFDQPFRNVYSVEILDASIPTVMYTIDIYSNQLYFAMMSKSEACVLVASIVANELSFSKTFSELFESSHPNSFLVCNEAQLSQYLQLNTLPHFIPDSTTNIAIRYVKENNLIELANNQSSHDYFFFTFENMFYCILNIPSNQHVIDIIQDGNFFLEVNSLNTYDIVYFIFITVSNDIFNQIQNAGNYWFLCQNIRYSVEIGNYDITTLKSKLNIDLNLQYGITVSTNGNNDSFQGKFVFYSTDLLMINGSIRQLDNIIGFDMYPQTNDNGDYFPMIVGSNKQVFKSVFINGQYEMTPPGIVNLRGERYLILRCKEMEDMMYGSFAYDSCTPGIGLFKLESGQNLNTNLRWDFITLSRKPMHPIGKLTRMSFRFEMRDGNLYDFKTVNHQFLLAIKYYNPTSKEKFRKSTLNPNYIPNLIEYKFSNPPNQDEEEEVDEDTEYKQYTKEIKKYQGKD